MVSAWYKETDFQATRDMCISTFNNAGSMHKIDTDSITQTSSMEQGEWEADHNTSQETFGNDRCGLRVDLP